MRIYPDNTLASFKVQLPTPVQLEGEHEIALTEIQYPRTWRNVHDMSFTLGISDGGASCTYQLKPGFYSDVVQIVRALNDLIRDEAKFNGIRFVNNNISKRVSVEVTPKCFVILNPKLRDLLGFKVGTLTVNTTGGRPADVHQGFYALYVYSNLVESQIVGDTRAPLLRVVPQKGKDGDYIIHGYVTPMYLPLKYNYFSTVEINLRDDTGRPVPFEAGKVVVTLHIRRRRT